MILLLFTATYPYDGGAEQTFLDTEIPQLCSVFDRVVLVPRKRLGSLLPIPAGAEVEDSYSAALYGMNPLIALGSILFSELVFSDLITRPALFFHPQAIKRLIAYAVGAQLTRAWVENWLSRARVNAGDVIFYTYWFDQAALGIGLAKRTHREICLVSRVHGYDLYEEYYYNPPYWPCRPLTLSLLDCLYPDSQAGTKYLLRRYPEYSDKYKTAFLGVPDPGFLNQPSQDGVLRIVSCSMIRPEKRVELLLEGIRCAAELRPAMRFEWYHIGNGENRNRLQKMADEMLPRNARAYLPGYTDRQALMNFYRTTPLDVFVNVSITEGTPVSIMEAISCGLPVVATGVGGNREIVEKRNGILMDENPSPRHIAESIINLLEEPRSAHSRREGSRQIWQERYNAYANFAVFAEELHSIRKARKAE